MAILLNDLLKLTDEELKKFVKILENAKDFVEKCTCDDETSYYSCLKMYRN